MACAYCCDAALNDCERTITMRLATTISSTCIHALLLLGVALLGCSGGGGSGTGGTSGLIGCTALSNGCVCADGTPEAGGPATCSPSSVARTAGEQGFCCRSNPYCTCDSYVCEADDLQCMCGNTFVVDAVIQRTKLAACPAPATSQKCCLSMALRQCRCAASDCLGADEKEVPSCGVSDVSFCGDGWNTVTSCK